jgi:hypothetical protein
VRSKRATSALPDQIDKRLADDGEHPSAHDLAPAC